MPLWSRKQEPVGPATVTLSELIEDYDIVRVSPNAVMVQERPKKLASALGEVDLREFGSTSPGMFVSTHRQEYNAQLRGARGIEKYDEMRRSDGQIRAILRLAKTPVLAARWYVEPASDSVQDIRVAEFVNDCFMKFPSMSFPQMLSEILLCLEFGYYMLEKVWEFQDTKTVWKKLAPRHPLDVQEWHFDSHGGPAWVDMYADDPMQIVPIPISKLLVFSHDKEAGNIEGISILRSAFKHWYYKDNFYKIDAIQKERHGIGVPIIKLPPGFSTPDKHLAEEIGRNLRTNEKAHVVLPPMWDLLMLKMEGNPVDAITSIEHHDKMIARNVLGQFLNTQDGGVKEDQDMFMKATRHIADQVRDVFNKYAIPELVKFNWRTVDTFPELRVRRIGETVDWRTISFAMRNFIGAGAMRPDDRLEAWIRDEMDLPKPDKESVRQVATPQGPPRVGPPRQSTAAGSQQGKTAGKSNTGTDQSGG